MRELQDTVTLLRLRVSRGKGRGGVKQIHETATLLKLRVSRGRGSGERATGYCNPAHTEGK